MRWLALPLLLLAAPSGALVFEVTKTADTADGACDHDCSLREAVIAANARLGLDFVRLPSGRYIFTQAGAGEQAAATGDLDVSDPLFVVGAGAAETVIDAAGLDRVFEVPSKQDSLELYGVTVTGGVVAGDGGGIDARGPLTVARSVISGNRGKNGGGIHASQLTLRDSAVLDNESEDSGGGVHTDGSCPPVATSRIGRSTIARNTAGKSGGGLFGFGGEVVDSTFSGNHAALTGGGIYSLSGCDVFSNLTVVNNSADEVGGGAFGQALPGPTAGPRPIQRSILAGNTAGQAPECGGSLESGGANLFGSQACAPAAGDLAGTAEAPLDPLLAPLADHGGPTPTHAPLPGSPVVDFAESCSGVDQRGGPRPLDGNADNLARCDCGAVEASPACLPSPGSLCLGGGRFRVSASWKTGAGQSGQAGASTLTDDTGAFWFFAGDNLELMIKLLPGCDLNGHYWVFASGLTDVEVGITVVDTVTGQRRTYANAPGTAFTPRFDTAAFACN